MSVIDNQFVNLQIIKQNNAGDNYRRAAFAIIVFMVVFGVLYDEPVPRYTTMTVILLSGAVVVFLAIKLRLLKRHDELGWVVMTANYLVLKIGNKETEYALDHTTHLSVEVQGYTGEKIIGRWMKEKSGYDNFITLSNAAGTSRHEFLISNKMKLSIMDRLLDHYRAQGVVVQYNDKTSDETKKSLVINLFHIVRRLLE